MKPFYITTPIYYCNDRPHLGTTYSTVASDVFARYQKLRGRPTRFLTGLDEHGLKIERRAKDEGLAAQDFVDRMAAPFRTAWQELGCDFNDFIRTTEPRHKMRAQVLWQKMQANGDIYLGHYEDWYCVDCEAFYTHKDLVNDTLCPTHKKPVERIKEESYFFRLSSYTDKLLAFYDANPDFVRPEGRFREVKSFVREGLRDLSISRASFRWGVPVPGNSAHVMYVWLDALTNYISALGAPTEQGETGQLFQTYWPPQGEAVHIVGKDILRFHAVYWPAFLWSAGLFPPTQVWAHGWLTVNGEKMSKSAGNFLTPGPLVEALGADVVRYYLMRDIGFGQDGDFSHRNLLARYQGELSNGLGNLLHRTMGLVQNHFDAKVPTIDLRQLSDLDSQLQNTAQRCAETAALHFKAMAVNRSLDATWELVAAANKYVDETAPWALAKQGNSERLAEVCYMTLETLRWLGVMVWPVMPTKSNALRIQLGLPPLMPIVNVNYWPSAWGGLVGGASLKPGAPLFQRFDKAQEQSVLERLGAPASETPAVPRSVAAQTEPRKPLSPIPNMSHITIEDLSKLELRIGKVLSAKPVPKSDKLLVLMVDLGETAPRQILAGIGKSYDAESIVGRHIAVVANLPPRTMMGLESQGMVLAASDQTGLSVLNVDRDIAPGTRIS
ncbi:MAG: methionine--tRNA ligase [Myxococcales bacterium]|nr:methionine--tRNA ligase [Myxococcales bacterium]MCB9708235.1 methionine--tRNA ligase [Myxococcales bacterium]